ncbi:MAG: hypothetical protein M3R13_11580 [Armatimonadota bacterium]|nr:hypothetical protein [Armatimonadota bacterium]
MYMVVSHWKPLPGKQAEFEKNGLEARRRGRGIEGVVSIEAFWSGDEIVVVHTYTDAETYGRLMADDGPFAENMKDIGIEEAGEWIGSERGETLE